MEEERKMYDATCSDCGAACKVPFEPIKDKGVKCSECFKDSRPPRRDNNRGGGRGDRGGSWKKEFDVKCAECGKDTTVPFKPTGDRPVLCRECFRK